MDEIWKDISGYEGKYKVSNFGRVMSLNYNHTKKPKILKNSLTSVGYFGVSLFKQKAKKTFHIHRLVVESFLGRQDLCVNHKDYNKQNNKLSNLEYCSIAHNNTHAHMKKGKRGVYKTPTGYRAMLSFNGRVLRLGHSKDKNKCYKLYYDKFCELKGYPPW